MNTKNIQPETRIKLIKMKDEKNPPPTGTLGTVTRVQEMPSWNQTILSVRWDNGSSLNILLPDDEIEVLD
jgi:hypothetical protein